MWSRLLVSFGLILASLCSASAAQGDEAPRGTRLLLDGPVTPTIAAYIGEGIGAANAEGDALILLEIDTPGGLVTAMEDIVKAIKGSAVPVVAYVAPEGARALSAGFYILYASDVAAMAPSTTTGAATPVSLGGDGPGTADENDVSSDASMRRKVIESSVAYIRGLAAESGRDVNFAEAAVREGVSVTAREALDRGIVEIVASDRAALLVALDGRAVATRAGPVTLETDGIRFETRELSVLQSVLHLLADPNVAAILMTLGTTGLIVELWNPGSIFPGALGALCLSLALYSFSVLPFEGLYAAVMAIGALLIVFEAFTPTFGLAGAAGLAMVGAGLYYVFPADLRIGAGVLFGLLLGMGLFLAAVFWAVVRSREHGPLNGGEALLGQLGRAESWDGEAGWVIVAGERWRAEAARPIPRGAKVRVLAEDGLRLTVEPADPGMPGPLPHRNADAPAAPEEPAVRAGVADPRARHWRFRR